VGCCSSTPAAAEEAKESSSTEALVDALMYGRLSGRFVRLNDHTRRTDADIRGNQQGGFS
jgi:hypothetical protein